MCPAGPMNPRCLAGSTGVYILTTLRFERFCTCQAHLDCQGQGVVPSEPGSGMPASAAQRLHLLCKPPRHPLQAHPLTPHAPANLEMLSMVTVGY